MQEERKPKMTFQADEVAVPEVHTGEIAEEKALEEDDEEIRYDGVAIPEIHFRKRKPEK